MFKKVTVCCAIITALYLCLAACSAPLIPDPYTPHEQPPAPQLKHPVEVALVLGGGGSRSLAHAGAIEVLQAHQIPIHLIVGSSAGGMIGALYADDPDAERLKKKIIRLKKKDLLDPSMFSSLKMLWQINGHMRGDALRCFIKKQISAKNFVDLKIPLVIVTTDVDKGQTYNIRSGPILPALQASMAVPMVFKPVILYGRKLVDGGVSSPVPVEVAKEYHPKLTIAIDIGTSPDYGPVNTSYQLGYRSLHISYFYLSNWQGKQADILIHPNIDKYGMFEDGSNKEMYEAGRQAALNALPKIKEKLKQIRSSHG